MKPFSRVGGYNILGQNKMDKEATHLTSIRKIPNSNLDRDINHPN
jgi:hypothetical protein